MSNITESIVTILTAVIGVAILSVLVSRNSNTAGVLEAAGDSFGSVLGVAVSPITGGGGSFAMGNFGNSSFM